MVVKAFLVIAMTAFHLSIVPRRPGKDQLVLDSKLLAQIVHSMHPLRLAEICELCAVVRLDDCGLIAKVRNCTPDKIPGRVSKLTSCMNILMRQRL